MIKMTIFGGRVATNDKTHMKYYPEYVNAKGIKVSNRLTVPILVNEKNQETPFNMIVTVWGKLADICAKSLSPGREVNMEVEPKQYQSTYKQNGQPVLIENKPLTITNISYKVNEIKFGAESASHIASEISRKIRGIDWFKPGHEDNTALNIRRKNINNMNYIPGKTTFGYADVIGEKTPQTTQVTPQTTPVFSQEMLEAAMAHIQSQLPTTTINTPAAAINTSKTTISPTQVTATVAVDGDMPF